MKQLARIACLVAGHKWMSRKAHDGIHYRCGRCPSGYVQPYEPRPWNNAVGDAS